MLAIPVAKIPSIHTFNETPMGAINGFNDIFTTNLSFAQRTTRVYLNGVRQNIGIDNDYTETDINQITFTTMPQFRDSIIMDYIQLR
jgi:hypothetical protein